MTTNFSYRDDSMFYVLCKASHTMFQLCKGFREISLVDIFEKFLVLNYLIWFLVKKITSERPTDHIAIVTNIKELLKNKIKLIIQLILTGYVVVQENIKPSVINMAIKHRPASSV